MAPSNVKLTCPHCGATLKAFSLPDGSGWDEPYHWACFNNDCPYYREGWQWMQEQYQVRASYRYRVMDPKTHRNSPLAVWSDTAICDLIIDEKDLEE